SIPIYGLLLDDYAALESRLLAGIVVATMIAFLFSWNEHVYAQVLVTASDAATMPAAMTSFPFQVPQPAGGSETFPRARELQYSGGPTQHCPKSWPGAAYACNLGRPDL